MLTFLRKHQYGFMLIVAIIVIIAFTFFYSASDGSRTDPESAPAFKIAGETYSFRDLQDLQNQMTLMTSDRGGNGLRYYDTWNMLTSERLAPGAGGRLQSFAYNLNIFREEAKKLGIEASNEEVLRELKANPQFRSPGGSYDGALFDNFKTNTLAAFNVTPDEMLELVRDKIRIDKLADLLAAGTTASEVQVDERYQEENQKVVAYALTYPMEKAQDGLEVSPEKIKEHYDKNIEDGTSLKTDEKRQIEYAFFPDPTVRKSAATPGASPIEFPPGLLPEPTPTPIPSDPTPATGTDGGDAPAETTPTPDGAPAPEDDAAEPASEEATGEVGAEESATGTVGEEASNEASAEGDPGADAAAEGESDEGAAGEEGADGCQGEAEVVDDTDAPVEDSEAAEDAEATPDETGEAEAEGETTGTAAGEQPADAEPAGATAEATPSDTGTPTDGDAPSPEATTGAEADATPTPAPTPEPPKPLTADERKALNQKYKETLDRFLNEVREPGADFASIAKKFVAEGEDGEIEARYFRIEEPFSRSEPPTELMTAPMVMREVFSRDPEKEQIFNVRKSYGDDQGFFIVRIIDVEESRDLTLEEATEQISEALMGDAAIDKIEADLEAAKEKLSSAKDGPAFKAAAEELGYEVKRVSFTRTPPATEGVNSEMLRSAVASTAPGQISKPQFDDESGGLLVYVAQKTVDEGDDAAERKKNSIATSIEDRELKSALFQSWLQEVRKNYDIKVIAELQRNAQG